MTATASPRRAVLAIVLAGLLAMTFAASAHATGRVWIESDIDYNGAEYTLGRAPEPTLLVHNDTDTPLSLKDFISSQPSIFTFRAGDVEDCETIPAHGQCDLHASISIP